ncbi:DUF4232 domain-containing protein [Pseudonocardia alaniniphila]|uniref:DUF4232 domain-containing protein n=1 Tax=Pseudonocardia alaniniphila TaxID=75291 RepID=A0ABS9TLX9_9PSEU|nr:DUF4232 domain-containing protein [Pseudonocardia alaniniphila]MCH6169547.1 DUF4232 domain-containing protein [Pseudonocardia alaniniphila]
MLDIDVATTAWRLRIARTVTVAGLLVMLVGAVVAARYTPFWFDPGECSLHDRCVTPKSTAMLQAMWWVVGIGIVVVLAGLALTWRALPGTPEPTTAYPLPVWGRAGAAALVGVTFGGVLGFLVLGSMFFAFQAFPVALCVFWLLQGHALAWVQLRTAPPRRSVRADWTIGLSVSAVAITVGALPAVPHLALALFALVNAAVLVAAVLLDQALPARTGRLSEYGPVQRRAGTVLAALAVAVVGYVVFTAVPHPEPDTTPLPSPPQLQPAIAPEKLPTTSNVPMPTPPVEADTPCAPDDLTWSTTGWDATMGSRAVTVVATHHGRRPCYLDGFAGITIAQGGRPLHLVVEPASIARPGLPVAAQRVGVAPRGTAAFTVFWKGYGAAADHKTPQTLDVVLPGGANPSAVPLGDGPPPFDVVDGATVHVDAWRPGVP